MGKQLLTYEDFTRSDIINRATSGICTLTDKTTYVDASGITITGIKNAISGSNYNLSDLCKSANINKWSWFGPRQWDISNGALYDHNRLPYNEGYFAGYTHNASAPFSYDKSITPTTVNQDVSTLVTISVTVNLGQIQWSNTGSGQIWQIGLDSKISSVSKKIKYIPFITSSNHIQTVDSSFYINLNVASDIDNYLFFAESNNTKVSDIPNISSFTFSVAINERAKLGNITLSSAIQAQYPDWQFGMNEAYVTQYDDSGDTYYLDFTAVYDSSEASYPVYTFDLFAQLNSGSFQDCSQTVAFDGNGGNVIVSGNLPFEITYGDTVNFELQ